MTKFTIKESEIIKHEPERECLHDKCPDCNGTGIKKNGLGSCIHMISCKCPKCNPRFK